MKKGYFMVGKAMARMLFRQRRPVIVQTSNMHPDYNCDKERGMKVTFYTTN
jgi:hypothetical protein